MSIQDDLPVFFPFFVVIAGNFHPCLVALKRMLYTSLEASYMTNVIPTGSLRLDRALGGGGMRRGQVCEISGPPGSGKTTLGYHILAQAQMMGEPCALLDLDHSLDTRYAAVCGLQPRLLYICHPPTIQSALAITKSLVQSSAFAVVMMDSVTSLPYLPGSEALSETSRLSHPHSLFALTLPHLKVLSQSSQTLLLATTQIPPGYGGAVYHQLHDHLDRIALQLHADARLQLHEEEKQSEPELGEWIKVHIIKNTIVPAYFATKLFIMYNQGIAKAIDCIDLGVELKVIRISDQGLFFQGLHLGNGRRESISFLRRNPNQLKEIEELIRLKYFSPA